LAPNGTFVLWCKDYENAIRAFDYATLIDDEFWCFMERAKAFERLKRYEEAIVSYTERLN
jgi:tetratricopeptide (TPR) repeat protein